jgi:class 3 adenylate cyclase
LDLEEFQSSLAAEVQEITSSDFSVVISPTDLVPGVDDPEITYPNLVTKVQKCKLIETCVLYIDIRRSTNLSLDHRRSTLSKLYSSFVRAMARCGEYYGGKIRNIVGDRLMVIFDSKDCFTSAVNTAILMNSVSQYLLDRNFSQDDVVCGIGIDYGKMLASKVGIIKRGAENTATKSLVWLGRPANIASKLTDAANRTTYRTVPTVDQGFHYPNIGEYGWFEIDTPDFLNSLEETGSPVLRHPDEHFFAFVQSSRTASKRTPPVLMTEPVFDGYKAAVPNEPSVKQSWWHPQTVYVPGYSKKVYGGDVIYTQFKGS